MFGRTVFSVGEQAILTDDLVLVAILSGRWDGLRRQTQAMLEADRELRGLEDARLEAAVEEAAAEFRYDRDLINASDAERWLEDRGIAVDDWLDALRRRLLAPAALPRALLPAPPDPPELLQATWAEFVLSGMAMELAGQLARQSVAHELAAGNTPAPPPDEATLAQDVELVGMHFPDLGVDDTRARLLRLDSLASAVGRLSATAVTPDVVRREIDHRALDLLQLDCKIAVFEDELRAREAALCVREDGMALEEVAEDAHTGVEALRLCIEDLDSGLRNAFRSASAGELLGPLPWEGRPALVLVTGKHRPTAEDPEVRGRAERGLLDRLLGERLETQVRWSLRF